jgi:hypothetical protein
MLRSPALPAAVFRPHLVIWPGGSVPVSSRRHGGRSGLTSTASSQPSSEPTAWHRGGLRRLGLSPCRYRRLLHRREGGRVVAIGGSFIAEKANVLWLSAPSSSQRRPTRCGNRRLPHRRAGERVVAIGGSLIAEKADALWLSAAPSSQRRRTCCGYRRLPHRREGRRVGTVRHHRLGWNRAEHVKHTDKYHTPVSSNSSTGNVNPY